MNRWNKKALLIGSTLLTLLLIVVGLVGLSKPKLPEPQVTQGEQSVRLKDALQKDLTTIKREGLQVRMISAGKYGPLTNDSSLSTDFLISVGESFIQKRDHHYNAEFVLMKIHEKGIVLHYTYSWSQPVKPHRGQDTGEIELGWR